MDFKITTKKTGAGHFTVTIFDNKKWEEIGEFETTDMQLVDDISEMNDEVTETCLSLISETPDF